MSGHEIVHHIITSPTTDEPLEQTISGVLSYARQIAPFFGIPEILTIQLDVVSLQLRRTHRTLLSFNANLKG